MIPILLPGAQRPSRGDLPLALVTTIWVEFDQTLDDQSALGQLLDRVRGVESRRRPEPINDEAGPYRGLEAFEPADAPFFFGREALTQWLVSELRPQMEPGRNRFLAIVGTSGSGKSSLALAGLLPALQQGRIHGSSQWPVVRCRPGRDPVESLAVALLANPTLRNSGTLPSVDELMQKLRENKETLHLTTRVADATKRMPVAWSCWPISSRKSSPNAIARIRAGVLSTT